MNKIESIEEFKERNIGFRLLYNPDQTQSSAILFLQWCLAPQVAQYMKENAMHGAAVFISIRNPRGRETRFVFPLASTQELIEFHCPGTHEINGMLIWNWNEKLNEARKMFLEKEDRRDYKWSSSLALRESDCSLLGEADLSVDVANGFFAPKLSAFEDWYINLWYNEPPWDECAISHRRRNAYFVQTPLLALWIPMICMIRLLVAFALVLKLRKDIPWAAVMHPFDYDTSDLWKMSSARWTDNWPIVRLFAPLNQIFICFASVVLSWPISWFTDFSFLVSTVTAYGVIMLIFIAINVVSGMISKEMLEEWKKTAEENEVRRKAERFDALYSELLCTTAPATGVRTKRRGFKNNAVLVYHNLKARMCRPTTQG